MRRSKCIERDGRGGWRLAPGFGEDNGGWFANVLSDAENAASFIVNPVGTAAGALGRYSGSATAQAMSATASAPQTGPAAQAAAAQQQAQVAQAQAAAAQQQAQAQATAARIAAMQQRAIRARLLIGGGALTLLGGVLFAVLRRPSLPATPVTVAKAA